MQRWTGASDRLAQRLGAVDHEQRPLLGVEAALDQITQERGRDRRVFGRALPMRAAWVAEVVKRAKADPKTRF
jgi:hypothetical protein